MLNKDINILGMERRQTKQYTAQETEKISNMPPPPPNQGRNPCAHECVAVLVSYKSKTQSGLVKQSLHFCPENHYFGYKS